MRALLAVIVLALSAAAAHAAPQLLATPSSLAFGNVPQGKTAQLTFVLANDGDATTTITSTTYGGTIAGYTVSGVPASLAPGTKATVTVTYAPVPGKDGGLAAIFFASNALAPVSVIISGNDGPLTLTCPVCTTDTTGYVRADYGVVGWQSTASQPFTMTNTWLSDVTVEKLTSTYEYSIDAPAVPFTIPAGGSVTFSVATVPGVATSGYTQGDLFVFTDATPGLSTIRCSMGAETVSGEVDLTPGSSVDFGGVDLRATTPATRTITIENVGLEPLSITDWPALAGGGFTSPSVAPVTISPGASQSVTVTYQPIAERTAQAPDTATLVVSIDGLIGEPQPFAQTITLTGHGTDRHVRLTGAPIAFPPTFLDPSGPAAPVAAVTLTNTGEAPLDVSALTLDGEPVFGVLETAPFIVDGGQSTELHVRFVPPSVGSFTGTLAIVHDDEATPTPGTSEVAISGTGVSRMLGVSPTDPIDLGDVRIGETARLSDQGRAITITNLDPIRSMTISAVECGEPSGTSAPTFTTPLLPTPPVLAPGQSASFDVDFAPTDVGPLRGSFLVYFDGDAFPYVHIPLTGTGVPARNTYYACAAGDGSGGGGLVIALAIGLVTMRRRRRASRRGARHAGRELCQR